MSSLQNVPDVQNVQSESAYLLEVSHLMKEFAAQARHVRALFDVNLDTRLGEFLTILGPSGCGKSTLLRCIAGFERPTAGEIRLDGRPVLRPGLDRIMVFQGFEQLFPWFTVRDNIVYALRVARIEKSKLAARRLAEEYLSLVGLKGFGDLYPHQLSGGMKQRVAISRALSVRPRILLMDEPFGSLDALTRSTLQRELIRIWQETRVTILFVTHNVEEAILLGDRIAVFSSNPGTIIEVVSNQLPRPRSPEQADFGRMWDYLHALLGFEQPTANQVAVTRLPALWGVT